MSEAQPDPGSFRDPSSRVYLQDHRVMRALDENASRELTELETAPWFQKAMKAGRIIETSPVVPASTLGLDVGWTGAVEHPTIDLWSYPTEWTFTMLQDAALLQLDLLSAALAEDFTCKDATPYNLQFRGTTPVFIDVGSFERLVPGDPWYGYLQFCQLFLNPLLLQAYADIPFQPLLRARVDGISPDVANRMLGVGRVWRRGVPVHVALHAFSQRRFASTKTDVKSALRSGGYSKKLIQANVDGLRGLVSRLRWKRSESEWSNYKERSHYTTDDLERKAAFVRDVAGTKRRRLVWDVGCNDGYFSRLVAPDADAVIALDHDHLVVDVLYRSLREDGPKNITPLVVDLSDPPPAIGWRSQERKAFLNRSQPDLVLFLAVIHHLTITANVPFSETLQLLRNLDTEVVLEFPTEDDPMVHTLTRNKRAGVHDNYRLDGFERAVEQVFTVERRERLASGTRELFHLRPA